MKVTFNIFSERDAAEAVGILLAVEDALRLISGDPVAERPATKAAAQPTTKDTAVVAEQPVAPKRGRPPGSSKNKVANGTAAKPTAVAAPSPANGTIETLPNGTVETLPNGHEQPDPFQGEEDIEAARDRLRSLAQERGVTWLRPQLEARGVTRLSELSDDQVREFLHGQA
jgi:hypothetical protein